MTWLHIDIHMTMAKLVSFGPQNNQVHQQVKLIEDDSLDRAAQMQESTYILQP